MKAARASVVSLAVILACGGGTEPTNNNNNNNGGGPITTCTSTSAAVTVNNDVFSPTCTTVPVNTTVTWTWGNNASNGHNVSFAGGPTSPTQTDGTFERTFTATGTFNYECTRHPGMNGQIRVQ